ncbi:MAG: RNA polymerase sigma factor [Calditrichia bacterium]
MGKVIVDKMEEEMEVASELQILTDCKAGSERAFQKLVEKYYQEAYSMAYYWTHDSEAAFDISQDAFVRVYKHMGKFDLKKPFRAWLFTIVKHLSFNYNRRVKRRWSFWEDWLGGKKQSPPELISYQPSLEKGETKRQIWQALKKLPEKDKDIILLKDFENFSYQEISEILDIPIGTVMSRLFHARKKLARLLEGIFNEE